MDSDIDHQAMLDAYARAIEAGADPDEAAAEAVALYGAAVIMARM